jgi:hypothetical protein
LCCVMLCMLQCGCEEKEEVSLMIVSTLELLFVSSVWLSRAAVCWLPPGKRTHEVKEWPSRAGKGIHQGSVFLFVMSFGSSVFHPSCVWCQLERSGLHGPRMRTVSLSISLCHELRLLDVSLETAHGVSLRMPLCCQLETRGPLLCCVLLCSVCCGALRVHGYGRAAGCFELMAVSSCWLLPERHKREVKEWAS